MRASSVLPVATLLLVPALASCGEGDGAASAPGGVAQQYSTLEAEVAERGGSTTSGEWKISYIVEAAEPWYQNHAGHQEFRAPMGTETHHIEVIPMEKTSGRIVPDVPITLEVLDDTGHVVDSKKLNFYYSAFYHYANNFSVPESGTYSLRAKLDPPTFLRHGEQNEPPALSTGATATFDDVDLTGN